MSPSAAKRRRSDPYTAAEGEAWRRTLARRCFSQRKKYIPSLGFRRRAKSLPSGLVFTPLELSNTLLDNLGKQKANDQRHLTPDQARRTVRVVGPPNSGTLAVAALPERSGLRHRVSE